MRLANLRHGLDSTTASLLHHPITLAHKIGDTRIVSDPLFNYISCSMRMQRSDAA
jgi:hypothetical protein